MALSQGFVRFSLGGSLVLLTACGGGGGSAPAPASSPTTVDVKTSTTASPLSANAGDTVTATAIVSNSGTEAIATAFETRIYLSADATIDSADELIGSGIVDTLDAGASTNVTATYTLPANLRSGTYYIGALADTGAVLDESDETNNQSQVALEVAGGTCSPDGYEEDDGSADAKALLMNTPQRHDHCDDGADWMVFSATAGTAYSLTTSDLGASADTRIEVYDTDAATLLATSSDALEPKASRLAWTAPSDGDYYLKVVADAGLSSTGVDTGYTVLLGEATSDLGVIGATVDATSLTAGGTASASLTLFNDGFTPSGSFVVKAYLSADGSIDAQDALVGTFTAPDIPAGQTAQLSNLDIAIPKETADGSYSLLFMADADNSVAEFNEGNNVSTAVPVTIAAAACAPDVWEDDDFSQYAAALTYGTAQSHNFCDDQRDWFVFDAVAGQAYLFEIGAGASDVSTTVYDGAQAAVNGWNVAANTTASNTFVAPATGPYYLLATTTAGGAGSDYSVTAYDNLPDLLPGTVSSNTGTAVLGGILDVTVTTRNDGLGDATTASETGIYLSTDTTIDKGDLLLGSVPVGPLAANTTQPDTVSLPVPDTLSEGTYYIGAVTDTGGQVTEVNETNNATATPTAVTVSAPPCTVDGNEQNDFIADATAFQLGTVQLNYCDDAYDWFQVDLTQNTGYLLSAVPGASASTTFDIYDTDGSTVLLQDAQNVAYLEPQATGTYYVLAKESTGTSGLNTGYTLNVSQCDKDAFEPDDTADTAPLISSGVPQTRNMCDDGHDMATFDAIAGYTYVLTISGTVQNPKPSISISDGSNIIVFDDPTNPGFIQWKADVTKRLYLVVDGVQGLNSGYDLELLEVYLP